MVNYFIYAKDFSGSTEEVDYYHTNGLKTLEQFKSDVQRINYELLKAGEQNMKSRIIYLHWGHCCFAVSEKVSIETYKKRSSGRMSTEPGTIIKFIKQNYCIDGKKNKIKLLYIITDGCISEYESQECVKLNENMHYETVVFHAINEDLDQINLSVVASFLKSRCMIYRNDELFDNTDISQDFDYDAVNVKNYDSEKGKLKSFIKLKYLNKSKHNALALREIDELKKLRNRLFAELASLTEKTKVNLETKDRQEFLREFVKTDWYRNLNVPAYDMKVEIEKSIQTMINYIVSEKKSHSFDALKFDTTYDKPVEEEPIVDVTFTAEQEIEFPDIILDDDKGIPVILLTEFSLLDKIIFHKTNEPSDEVSPASFNKFNSAMECPLYLLNDPDVSESIGYFYTLNVYKQLLENTNKTEPRTRKPFHGGLVLLDTDEFDKYNDYVLAATYFNFKKVKYNVGLFYYVLWKNCENKEWMDKNVVEQFKKYVMRRISVTKCKVGLSSLPLDPPVITLLPTALWYSLELSSYLFKDDPLNFIHERLRMYYGVAHCMIEILKQFEYDLDLESIGKRINIIRHVMTLKQIPTQAEKVYYIVKNIFKEVNGFLICEIEHPSNLTMLNYLNVNHKGMLRDDVIEGKIHLNEYVHLMHFVDSAHNPKVEIKICDTTLRPYFTVDKNKSFYTELVSVAKKVVINNDDDKDKVHITFDALDSLEFDKILSWYNLYIKCVLDTGNYPTLSEYIAYILRRKKFNGDLVTIFAPNCYSGAEEAYSHYTTSLVNVDPNTFIKVCKQYVSRLERIKSENVRKFHSDNEINKFITSEELKVNLRKNVCKK